MDSSPSTPPKDERAALSELERIEAVVQSAPTSRVRARALIVLDRLLRAPEIEQARENLGELIDKYHAAAREHGELSDEEIEAEIRASREERRQSAG